MTGDVLDTTKLREGLMNFCCTTAGGGFRLDVTVTFPIDSKLNIQTAGCLLHCTLRASIACQVSQDNPGGSNGKQITLAQRPNT